MTSKLLFNYPIIRTASLILGLVVIGLAAGNFVSQPASAASSTPANVEHCNKNIFGMRAWYYYMDQEFTSASAPKDIHGNQDACEIKCFNIFDLSTPNDCGKKSSDIPAVFLAVIDDLLRVAGLVAVAFVLVGAFKYVISEGNPEKTSEAKSSILNALIGMAVAMTAIAFISFIGSKLT